jgi:hypothetical protein
VTSADAGCALIFSFYSSLRAIEQKGACSQNYLPNI